MSLRRGRLRRKTIRLFKQKAFVILGAGVVVAITCLSFLKMGGHRDQSLITRKLEASKPGKNVKTPSWVTSQEQQSDRQYGVLTSSQASNESSACEPVPIEWEEPLFEILLDQKEGANKRCLKLIEMATVSAKNVPSVQRECLKHLIYSLQDTDSDLFLLVSMSPAIPVQMRVEFVREVVGIRPDELCELLCSRLAGTKEPLLAEYAISYLNDRKAEKAAVINTSNH